VQTALPKPSPEEQNKEDEVDEEELARVSRQELYAAAEDWAVSF